MEGLSRKNLLHSAFSGRSYASRLRPAIIAASALFLPQLVAIETIPLMPCTFLEWTGYPCPLCGTTRSFWAMANADWRWAFYNSPFGALLYISVLVFALLNIAVFSTEVLKGRKMSLSLWPHSSTKFLLALGAALAANWVYRLALGLK